MSVDTATQRRAEYMRKWAAANSEKCREKSRKWRAANPEKQREYWRKCYAANPEKKLKSVRKYHLKKTYGLTPVQTQAILEQQGNCCAICRTDVSGTWCVDHDHATNVVRGLLCRLCNAGLGIFADDPARMEAAAAYVRGKK